MGLCFGNFFVLTQRSNNKRDEGPRMTFDPGRVVAISRGLSAATPPVDWLQIELHPGRGASSSTRGTALKSSATRARIAAATPSGVETYWTSVVPGVSLRSTPG